MPQVSAVVAERHLPSAPMQLPQTYRRLVGRHVGQSFRDVCEEETAEVSPPGEGKVCNKFLALHNDPVARTQSSVQILNALPLRAKLVPSAPAQAPAECQAGSHSCFKRDNALLCSSNCLVSSSAGVWSSVLENVLLGQPQGTCKLRRCLSRSSGRASMAAVRHSE